MANEDCAVRIERNGSEQSEELCLKIPNEELAVKIEYEKTEDFHGDVSEVKIQLVESDVKIQNDQSEANSPTHTDESDQNSLFEKQKLSSTKSKF